MNARLTSLLLVCATLAGPARADLVLERTVREFGPKPAEKAEKKEAAEAPASPAEPAPAPKPEIVELAVKHYTVKMAAGRLRETCREDGTVTIVRADPGVVWLIDPAKKAYREIPFQALDSAANQSRERLLRRVPLVSDVKLRERLRSILADDQPEPALTIERPGTRKTVAGESCELWVVRAGGEELFRAYVSGRAAPQLGPSWLSAGKLFSKEAAAKLAEIRGLVMEATFPLADGGRVEVLTERLAEAEAAPGDYDDPKALGYARLGGAPEKPAERPAKKAEEKPSDPAAPPKSR
jgi:hypothetical protein